MLIQISNLISSILLLSIKKHSTVNKKSFIVRVANNDEQNSSNEEIKVWVSRGEKVLALRSILRNNDLTIMPCCFDGISARLIERAGFSLTFMTGFGVAATYGVPDTGLLGSSEMSHSASIICNTLQRIPCIGDGDTGYGNPMNVQRTIRQYVQSGLAGIMIEDQVAPKRCGHTEGKQVVTRDEAYRRVRAAVEARDRGDDIVILARTDARATLGLEEAIERCRGFMELGADWTFLEAPQSEAEMLQYCRSVPGPKLANMLEFGKTPILPPADLRRIGYTVAAFPLTLLSANIKAMSTALERLKTGQSTADTQLLTDFSTVQEIVGFTDYNRELAKY